MDSPTIDEEWRDIPGFEGAYQASDLGRVRSLDRITVRQRRNGAVSYRMKGRVLKIVLNKAGYAWATFSAREQFFVHRLILEAFVRTRQLGEECRHLDGNPANNRLSNLCWGTPLENAHDRKRLGRERRGENKPNARLTEAEVRYIREERKRARSYSEIARVFGISKTHAYSVANGRTWAWLE